MAKIIKGAARPIAMIEQPLQSSPYKPARGFDGNPRARHRSGIKNEVPPAGKVCNYYDCCSVEMASEQKNGGPRETPSRFSQQYTKDHAQWSKAVSAALIAG
ncbi:MAG: hypothetical protein WDN46_09485 [Methylocella sp.]